MNRRTFIKSIAVAVAAPTALMAAPKPTWIRMAEQLPKMGQDVIVLCYDTPYHPYKIEDYNPDDMGKEMWFHGCKRVSEKTTIADNKKYFGYVEPLLKRKEGENAVHFNREFTYRKTTVPSYASSDGKLVKEWLIALVDVDTEKLVTHTQWMNNDVLCLGDWDYMNLPITQFKLKNYHNIFWRPTPKDLNDIMPLPPVIKQIQYC